MQHFGFLEDWRNFGNPQTFDKFLQFGVVLILRYLLIDLLLILALVRPGPKFLFFSKISTGGEKSKKHKVFFEDPAGGHNRIQFDGCPYIIVGRKVYDCQHGVDRHAKEKQRNQQNRVSERQLPIDGYYEIKMCCM